MREGVLSLSESVVGRVGRLVTSLSYAARNDLKRAALVSLLRYDKQDSQLFYDDVDALCSYFERYRMDAIQNMD